MLAGAFLSEYGLNIWVFGIVEMTSSLVLGLSSGALFDSILRADRGRRLLLIAGTVGGYAAPDTYVLAYSGNFPASTLIVVACVVVIGLGGSMVSIKRGLALKSTQFESESADVSRSVS